MGVSGFGTASFIRRQNARRFLRLPALPRHDDERGGLIVDRHRVEHPPSNTPPRTSLRSDRAITMADPRDHHPAI
jgi:hypothetical protein